MAVDVGSAKGYLDLDISGFLSGLKTAQSEADTASKSIATKIGNNISNVGKGLTSAGTTLTKNLTIPLLGIGAAGIKVASDFEKGMSEVKAISGATGKDFDALREKAIELGASTAFSAGEVAEAMTEMAKAGWSSQQIVDGMSGVLDAAAASGEGLATVSTIVADTITGFGMAAADSAKVADLLTQAANSGTIGITDLGESFKYIAPVAGSMGLSVEDVTTALSAMSMAGIKGSQAGTSLRTMLTKMVKPTDAVAEAMNELGIELTNSDGTFKSLDDIVAMMRNSFSGLTDEQKTYYATVLSGQEGMSGLLSLLNLTEEEYNAIAESMENSSGVAQETAAVMQDNLQSKVEQLVGSLESLAIKLADHVIPYAQKLVEWLTSLVEKFTALDPETQKTILKFAGLAAAAGPALVVVGKLTTGVGSLVTAFGNAPGVITKFAGGITSLTSKLSGVPAITTVASSSTVSLGSSMSALGTSLGGLASAAGPILAVVAAIAVLVAAIVTLWKNNEEFRDRITAICDQFKATFEKLTGGIVERLNRLGFDFESLSEVFFTIWKGFCDLLAPYFTGVFNNISIMFDFIVDHILNILDFWIAIFTGDWEGALEAIKNIFINIWEFIRDWFLNILNVLTGTLDVVLGWFGTSWTECWEAIKVFFVNIWNGIVEFFSGAWEGIKNVVTVGVMFIVELIKAWFNLVTLPFRFIWENCKDIITSVWNAIKEKISNTINNIKTIIMFVFDAVKAYFTMVFNIYKTIFTTVFDFIKTKVTTIVNAVKTVITTVFNNIKTIVTNVWNGIKNAITGPINVAKTTISNIINSIKDIISNGFNTAKNTVTNVFNNIKNTISNILNSAKTIVSNAINKIKSFFNFSWSLPKLKMPHFSIKGSFSLSPPSVPKLAIDWYKKAMSGGMILNSPTIFGYDASSGQFLGGGEAGSETVVGTSSLMKMIRQAVVDAIKPIISATHQLAKASNELGYITYNSFAKQAQVFEKVATSGVTGSGDTFIFNSPKAIDEIEAAKQMKKAKRDLAEGF